MNKVKGKNTKITVITERKCDFCGKQAEYDGKTKLGFWSYMCQECWDVHSFKTLGTGFGQRLVQKTNKTICN